MTCPFPNAELVPALWFPLVKKFYQAYYPSGRPNKADPIWAIKQKDIILAAVRLKQFNDCQLLTAMVTHPNYRNQGLGHHLINNLQAILNQKACYCFALNHLTDFYISNHFQPILPEQLPYELEKRFRSYQSQGRKIISMHYIAP
ncbi:GNAT family N-acetyltransferase [Marinomonas sp. THO17]|uniref:GNAT family N-acetyltransferase n=1 Tax=Marinomonas sp. THO17 TaxID=3149048 RepID=UPI00336BF84F